MIWLKGYIGQNLKRSVDIAMKLGVDTRKAEEQVRGAVDLPHGTGKSKSSCFCRREKRLKEAEEAGADFVGAEDLAEKIQKGWTDFDSYYRNTRYDENCW